MVVAPRAGAWIETMNCWSIAGRPRVAPRAGAWIETLLVDPQGRPRPRVAPRAGAWIETLLAPARLRRVASHPVRVRGLKPIDNKPDPREQIVAPRAGAWIETRRAAEGVRAAWVAPRAGAWIETTAPLISSSVWSIVAPRAGAWIET